MRIAEVTNETLERLIAVHVMGWELREQPLVFGTKKWWAMGEGLVRPKQMFKPSTDLNHAHEAELRLKELTPETLGAYVWEMANLVMEGGRRNPPTAQMLFARYTADARTRCLAMLRAVGVEVEP